MKYCMVIVTFAGNDEAERIISGLFEKGLIACAQLQDVRSRYIWKGELVRDEEVTAFLKTRADMFEKIEVYIKSVHLYEVPEIIQLPIEKGTAEYLGWIDECINEEK